MGQGHESQVHSARQGIGVCRFEIEVDQPAKSRKSLANRAPRPLLGSHRGQFELGVAQHAAQQLEPGVPAGPHDPYPHETLPSAPPDSRGPQKKREARVASRCRNSEFSTLFSTCRSDCESIVPWGISWVSVPLAPRIDAL